MYVTLRSVVVGIVRPPGRRQGADLQFSGNMFDAHSRAIYPVALNAS
jgi:hypothetical protein